MNDLGLQLLNPRLSFFTIGQVTNEAREEAAMF